MKEIDEYILKQVIHKHRLLDASRLRPNVWKRSALSKFLRKHGYSLSQIGRMIGKDHATIIHAQKIYDNNLMYDDFRQCIAQLESDLEDCVFDYTPMVDDINTKFVMSQVRLENLIGDKLCGTK